MLKRTTCPGQERILPGNKMFFFWGTKKLLFFIQLLIIPLSSTGLQSWRILHIMNIIYLNYETLVSSWAIIISACTWNKPYLLKSWPPVGFACFFLSIWLLSHKHDLKRFLSHNSFFKSLIIQQYERWLQFLFHGLNKFVQALQLWVLFHFSFS